MIDIEISNISSRLIPILKRNNVKRASLFGSFARGENREGSDIDIMVEYGAGTTLFKAAKLKMDLEDELGCKIDLISHNDLHPRIKRHVLKDQITIL